MLFEGGVGSNSIWSADKPRPTGYRRGMVSVLGSEVSVLVDGVVVGLVGATGAQNGPSGPALVDLIGRATVSAKAPDDEKARTAPVRDLLRHGKYKPTGRGKPASEYLLGAAREGRFPAVGALVDALNLVSLETLLPISLIDLERAGTRQLSIRRGKPGESYVFNPSGQVLDVEDLLTVAVLPEDRAVATPVKDSMSTKLVPESREVLAVVWAPSSARAALARAVASLEVLFKTHGAAAATAAAIASK